jgi:ion channel-forming bestrophin family protein
MMLSISMQIRNLSRLIWVNVNITNPNTNSLSTSTSKISVYNARQSSSDDKTLLTPDNLKLQKVRALKLLLSYAYAVKHHLRGEEGTDWPDYEGVLPADFARFDELGFDRMANSYSSVTSRQKDASLGKKVRKIPSQPVVTNSTTPLLTDSHQTVEFHAYADQLSLPLPMVYGYAPTLSWSNTDIIMLQHYPRNHPHSL